jgi:putative salt-induced outer membrane protein YdiY
MPSIKLLLACSILASVSLVATDAAAQNIAPSALTIPASAGWQQPTGWTGTVGAGVSISRGNNDQTQASVNADVSRATVDNRIIFHGLYVRGETDGTVNTDNAIVTGRYEHNLNPQYFSYGQADFERDPVNDLTFRQTYGGGLGYRLLRTDAHQLNIYTGLAYVIENNKVDEDTHGVQALVGNDYTWNLTPDSVFKQSFAYYPHMGSTGERAILQTSITSKLVGIVALQVSLLAKYRADVPDGVHNTDYVFITGLTAKF